MYVCMYVQSLINKHLELTVLLSTSLQSVDVLCFTGHWLSEDQINMLEIHNFKLVSKFCRKWKWRVMYICKEGVKC
jgi:hypothetical protein